MVDVVYLIGLNDSNAAVAFQRGSLTLRPPTIQSLTNELLAKSLRIFDGEVVVGKGSGHGTPHAYDRTVPMLVRAPGAIEASGVIEDPVDFSAFAALEAAFAGLDKRAPRDILAALRVSHAPARTP